jgi:hypothetical protein
MRYEVILPPSMIDDLRSHLLIDRTREQMAITLCGVARTNGCVRLLGRHLVLMPPEAFAHQSAGGLVLDRSVQQHVLQLAARERLSQVDWHTHPGESSTVDFSGIDDRSEHELALYLSTRLPGTLYGSVVLNTRAASARVWQVRNREARPIPIPVPKLDNADLRDDSREAAAIDDRFDRQVRAFGAAFQQRLRMLKVGVVGTGGTGSIVIEQLARLGVSEWVLVDPDRVEISNLNRLVGATARDVEEERLKVEVAARNIRRVDPRARIQTLAVSVYNPSVLKKLKDCDLLIAATDNEASRLVLNGFACQYLIPLLHLGVNLEPEEAQGFKDISGEVVIPELGAWCLLCAGVIDPQRAAWDLAGTQERAQLANRGYLSDTPAPAVYHLNGVVASLAAAEIHNFVWRYKPLRRYLVYRELEGELMTLQVPAAENCIHCGPEGQRGLGDLIPFWLPRPTRLLSLPPAGGEPFEERSLALVQQAPSAE